MATLDMLMLGKKRGRADDFCHGHYNRWTWLNMLNAEEPTARQVNSGGESLRRVEFVFQSLQVVDEDVAPIGLQHSFGLQAGEIPGNQLAYRANLRCHFLVGDRESNLHTLSGALAGLLGESQEIGGKPVAHGSE